MYQYLFIIVTLPSPVLLYSSTIGQVLCVWIYVIIIVIDCG